MTSESALSVKVENNVDEDYTSPPKLERHQSFSAPNTPRSAQRQSSFEGGWDQAKRNNHIAPLTQNRFARILADRDSPMTDRVRSGYNKKKKPSENQKKNKGDNFHRNKRNSPPSGKGFGIVNRAGPKRSPSPLTLRPPSMGSSANVSKRASPEMKPMRNPWKSKSKVASLIQGRPLNWRVDTASTDCAIDVNYTPSPGQKATSKRYRVHGELVSQSSAVFRRAFEESGASQVQMGLPARAALSFEIALDVAYGSRDVKITDRNVAPLVFLGERLKMESLLSLTNAAIPRPMTTEFAIRFLSSGLNTRVNRACELCLLSELDFLTGVDLLKLGAVGLAKVLSLELNSKRRSIALYKTLESTTKEVLALEILKVAGPASALELIRTVKMDPATDQLVLDFASTNWRPWEDAEPSPLVGLNPTTFVRVLSRAKHLDEKGLFLALGRFAEVNGKSAFSEEDMIQRKLAVRQILGVREEKAREDNARAEMGQGYHSRRRGGEPVHLNFNDPPAHLAPRRNSMADKYPPVPGMPERHARNPYAMPHVPAHHLRSNHGMDSFPNRSPGHHVMDPYHNRSAESSYHSSPLISASQQISVHRDPIAAHQLSLQQNFSTEHGTAGLSAAVCGGCKVMRDKFDFTKTQWRNRKRGVRRCKICIGHQGGPPPSPKNKNKVFKHEDNFGGHGHVNNDNVRLGMNTAMRAEANWSLNHNVRPVRA